MREEREQNQRFCSEQRERFRQRGVVLREQQRITQATIAANAGSCQQQAARIGDTLRAKQALLRHRRQQQEQAWQQHGHGLTEKYSTSGNQQLVRSLKEAIASEKEEVATEMRTLLKMLKKETDDGIIEVNCERVRRVYAETAHPVIRTQKQTMFTKRCDRAREVRTLVASWKLAHQQDKALAARPIARQPLERLKQKCSWIDPQWRDDQATPPNLATGMHDTTFDSEQVQVEERACKPSHASEPENEGWDLMNRIFGFRSSTKTAGVTIAVSV